MEEYKNLKVTKEVFDKFEELRYAMRFKTGISKTQSEFVNVLVNKYKLTIPRGKK